MKNLIVIILIVMSKLSVSQSFGTLSYGSTYGSSALDEPVNTFFINGKTYVFSNSNLATPNGSILTTYGGGDVICTIQDSIGVVKNTKVFGGYLLDKLIKVIPDGTGFWLYINSYSTVSGVRTLPQNCSNSKLANNDLYILRLDYDLNLKAEYSSCMGIGLFSGYGYPTTSVIGFSDIARKSNGNSVILVQCQGTSSQEVIVGVVEIDSVGYILKYKLHSVSGSLTTYSSPTGFTKLKARKVIVANDSINYVFGNYVTITSTVSPQTLRQVATVFKINMNTGNVTTRFILSKYSETVVNTAAFKSGKLYVFIEDFNIATGPTDYQNHFVGLGWPTSMLINRTTPYKTIAGKKDVFVCVLDSATLAASSQFAIGTNDDTDVKEVVNYDNNLIVGMSTKGGLALDKTSSSNGGYDYWFVRLNPTNNTIISQTSMGGSSDDVLNDFNIVNGVTIATGKSKSGISGIKTQASFDGGTFGDIWTLGFCVPPQISFYADKYNFMAGELVSFTNTSKYANTYKWDFKDGTNSYEENPKHWYYIPGIHNITLTGKSLTCGATQTYSNYFTVGTPVVGIEEYVFDETHFLFPNPVVSIVNIDGRYYDNKFYILNTLGEVVESGNVKEKLDLSNLAQGFYSFIIISKEKTITNKIIKE